MQPLNAPVIVSHVDPRTPEFGENRTDMLEKLEVIEKLHDEAELGGGAYHHDRLAKRGKLPVRERIRLALDPEAGDGGAPDAHRGGEHDAGPLTP